VIIVVNQGILLKKKIKRKSHESKNSEPKQRYRGNNGKFIHKNTSLNDKFKNLKLFISEVALSVEIDDENAWFIDSSALAHMYCNRAWYDEYYENLDGIYIYLGDNKSHKVQGYGVIIVKLPDGQVKQIHNVMYVLAIKKNLISISTIVDNDLKVEFVKSMCVVKDIQDHYMVVSTSTRVGGLYKLDVTMNNHLALASTTMAT
jgi:hypothetical protein